MFLRLLVSLSMFLGCMNVSYAEPDTRLLYLNGPITGARLEPLQRALDSVIVSGDGNRKAVTMVINSPGGSVIAGMSFVNKMQTIKEMGIHINCYVTDMAASMAFQILTQCTNRYALSTSYLLWHGVRMGTRSPITVVLARQIADDLERMDATILSQLQETLDLGSETIQKHFNNETLWSGLGLHAADPEFLDLMSGYPRLLPRLGSAVQMAESHDFFNQLDGYQYIWSTWQLRFSK